MTIAIENPKKIELSTEIKAVLGAMFAGYRRVIVRKAFGQGLSGGHVLEVRPVKADGTPELPAVVKLATISLIQKEWQAYQQHIRYRLPNVTEVTAAPVLLPQVGWGGLRYTLLGSSGTFEVVSLNDYFHRSETTATEIEQVGERLFRVMHHLWGYHELEADFSWQENYDGILPVNLRVEQQPERPGVIVTKLTPERLPIQPLRVGEWVRMKDFVLHKSNPVTQTITLNRPAPPAYYLRCKVTDPQKLLTYPVNEVVEPLVGVVVETRLSRLMAELKQAFGKELDPTLETVLLPGGEERLANPLCHLAELLTGVKEVRVSSVHGDFNLENILIEPETGAVSVIDFAEVRTGHILHDLLRLETEIITKFLPDLVATYDLPPWLTLATLYWSLHQTTAATSPRPITYPALDKIWTILTMIRRTTRHYLYNPNDMSEYYQSLVLYLLGALKFKNLSTLPSAPLPKQLAFWGATIIYALLTEQSPSSDRPPAWLAMVLKTALPERTPAPIESLPPLNKPSLSEAEQRLATLPLESIPNLGPLPSHSRMPLSRNPLFVGREADLKKLAHALKGRGTVAIGQVETTATTGLGGLGKTQLASEFVHRYGRFFVGGVFWLSFADPKAVPAEIAACGGANTLHLRPNFADLPLDEQVQLVQAAWQDPLPRLLIFDNCEDPDLLIRWRPTSGGCRVMVTSRRADWASTLGVQHLPLGVLQRWESIALLREHQPNAEDEILDAIAAELGDLPLALHLAGSYLARYRRSITPAQYLAQLQDPALLQHHSLKSQDVFSPTDHLQNVYRTISLSYDQLKPDDPIDKCALQLLAHAACLAPGEPIPYDLLTLSLDLPKDDLPAVLRVEDALHRLVELGLIRSETDDAVRLHRLIVAFVKEVVGDKLLSVQEFVEMTLYKEAKRINQAGYPGPLLVWQPHLRTVTDVALKRADERTAGLSSELGWHLWQVGDYDGGQPYFERALTIRQRIFGEEHPETAYSLNSLGYLLRSQGKMAKAGRYFKQALAIREKVLGEKHPDVAVSLNDIGHWLWLQDHNLEAQSYYEQALCIGQETLGEAHPLIAEYMNNLGVCLRALGNLSEARRYLEQALAINEQVFGPDHPDTALNFNNLGYLLHFSGNLPEAQTYHERALAIRQKVLGPEHPDTAQSLSNLGVVLLDLGNLERAKSYLESALTIREQVLGDEHIKTAICLAKLGEVLYALEDLAGAQQHLERALAIRQKVLGEEHELTTKVQNLLVAVLKDKKSDEAG